MKPCLVFLYREKRGIAGVCAPRLQRQRCLAANYHNLARWIIRFCTPAGCAEPLKTCAGVFVSTTPPDPSTKAQLLPSFTFSEEQNKCLSSMYNISLNISLLSTEKRY